PNPTKPSGNRGFLVFWPRRRPTASNPAQHDQTVPPRRISAGFIGNHHHEPTGRARKWITFDCSKLPWLGRRRCHDRVARVHQLAHTVLRGLRRTAASERSELHLAEKLAACV